MITEKRMFLEMHALEIQAQKEHVKQVFFFNNCIGFIYTYVPILDIFIRAFSEFFFVSFIIKKFHLKKMLQL